MRRMDKFVTVMAAGALLFEVAVASLLLFAGSSTGAHAAESAAPAATAPSLFDALDVNKDQVLSRQEFQAGYAGVQRLIAMRVRLHEQFGALDANHSGAIEASEYANLELIKRLGKTAPPLSAFDANHDQKIDFAEYTTLVRKLASEQTGRRTSRLTIPMLSRRRA